MQVLSELQAENEALMSKSANLSTYIEQIADEVNQLKIQNKKLMKKAKPTLLNNYELGKISKSNYYSTHLLSDPHDRHQGSKERPTSNTQNHTASHSIYSFSNIVSSPPREIDNMSAHTNYNTQTFSNQVKRSPMQIKKSIYTAQSEVKEQPRRANTIRYPASKANSNMVLQVSSDSDEL